MRRRRGPSTALNRTVGVVAAIVAAILLVVTFTQPAMPWQQPLQIKLAANSFGELNPNAHVDLGGTHIGTVSSVGFQNGHAVLNLTIQPQYAKLLHSDASGAIRPYGLLGPLYVDLSGGQYGQLQNGATIPLSRSTVSVDLQDVLNTLQPDVRDNLQTIFVEMGEASQNQGENMHLAIQDLGSAAANVTEVTGNLSNHNGDVAGIIDSSQVFNADVQYAPISQQIADTDAVLTALVQVENNLGDGIDQTANVMIELNDVMQGNVRNLSYVLQQSPATLMRLEKFMQEEGTLVNSVSPSLPSLMTAVIETQSAFSQSDASGHWVNVQAITGSCSVPSSYGGSPNPGCDQQPKPNPNQPSAHATSSSTSPGGGSAGLTDQQMIALMLGS